MKEKAREDRDIKRWRDVREKEKRVSKKKRRGEVKRRGEDWTGTGECVCPISQITTSTELLEQHSYVEKAKVSQTLKLSSTEYRLAGLRNAKYTRLWETSPTFAMPCKLKMSQYIKNSFCLYPSGPVVWDLTCRTWGFCLNRPNMNSQHWSKIQWKGGGGMRDTSFFVSFYRGNRRHLCSQKDW